MARVSIFIHGPSEYLYLWPEWVSSLMVRVSIFIYGQSEYLSVWPERVSIYGHSKYLYLWPELVSLFITSEYLYLRSEWVSLFMARVSIFIYGPSEYLYLWPEWVSLYMARMSTFIYGQSEYLYVWPEWVSLFITRVSIFIYSQNEYLYLSPKLVCLFIYGQNKYVYVWPEYRQNKLVNLKRLCFKVNNVDNLTIMNMFVIYIQQVVSMISYLVQGNYLYIGLQGKLCFCGTTYGNYGPSTACTSVCPGNSTTICGGTMANSVFALGGRPQISNSIHINRILLLAVVIINGNPTVVDE